MTGPEQPRQPPEPARPGQQRERLPREPAQPGQAMLAGMPRRLYPCTPTRLATWLDCPRRYRMTYLDRPSPPKGPPWAHNSLGASVHNALAAWWRLDVSSRTVSAAGDLLADGWINEGFASDAQSGQVRQQARQMVEQYVAALDPAREPLGVERTVAFKTDRIAVSGRIDRLDDRRAAPTAGLAVVDYKTGRRLLTPADVRTALPLALYALAAARVFHAPCHRVELHHLPTGTVHAWDHTDETLARHLRRAESIASECQAADEEFRGGLPDGEVTRVFPPRPGPGCAWCDYRSHCPEGMAAGPAHRPWDGLGPASDRKLAT